MIVPTLENNQGLLFPFGYGTILRVRHHHIIFLGLMVLYRMVFVVSKGYTFHFYHF